MLFRSYDMWQYTSRAVINGANTAMVQLIDTLVKTLDSYGDVLRGAEQIWISTIPYHRQILEGIQEKDFVKAGEACRIIYETDLHALQLKEEYDL